MTDIISKLHKKIPLIAVPLAVLLAASVAGAQEQPPVDLELSMANRFTDPTPDGGSESVFVVSVRNHSDVTVRDITVRLFGVEDLTLRRSVELSEYFAHVVDVNDGFLDLDALEWTIPYLKGGSTATTKLQINVFNVPDSLDPRYSGDSLVRLQAAIMESTPGEHPGRLGNNQARQYILWHIDVDEFIYNTNSLLGNNVSYGVDADPGTDTFTVRVTNPAYDPYPDWYDHYVTQYQLRLKVTPSDGLQYTATPPSGTSFNRATGIWNIGTLVAGSLPAGNKELEITVTGRGSLDVPAEDQCLTVEIEHVIPDPEVPRLPVTACMEHKALITDGLMGLFHWHDCLTESAYPCDSQASLELTAVKPAYGLAGGVSPNEAHAVADVHRGRLRSDELEYALTNNMILQPEESVVQVPDNPATRITDSGDTEWSTARLFTMYMDQTEFGYAWTGYKQSVTVSGIDGAAPPGRWRMGRFDSFLGDFVELLDAPDGTKVEGTPYEYDDIPLGDRTGFRIAFEELGTYVVLYEIEATNSGTTYTDSGTYTFHVGPVAELEVRDDPAYSLARPGQRAYNIVARNNGPDAAPAVDVTLTGVPQGAEAIASEGSYAQGICQNGLCEGVWTIGEMLDTISASYEGQVEAEVLTIIPGAGADANAEITATIENAMDYRVTIAGTIHTTDYYDYLDHNDEAQIALRSTPGDAMPGRADAPPSLRVDKFGTLALLRWQPVELVNGFDVTHYQVERNGVMLADDVGGIIYADLQGGTVNQSYRVRAVNDQGVPGPWSLPAGASGPLEPSVDLAAPTGLTATPGLNDAGRVDLSWFAPSGETGLRYRIEHATDGAGPWRTLVSSHGGTTYSHAGGNLLPGTTHYYRVAAVKGGVISTWAYVRTTMEAAVDEDGEQVWFDPPLWPENLRFTSIDRTSVTLVWDPPVDDRGSRVTGYEFRVFGPCASGADTVCDIYAPTRVSGTSRRVTGLNREGTYQLEVRALNAVGASDWSQSIQKEVGPETAGGGRVILSPSRLTVTEGGEATYRVKLSRNPTLPIVVFMHWNLSGTEDESLGSELPVQQGQVLLPTGYDTSVLSENCHGYNLKEISYAWNVGVPIMVAAPEDDDSEDDRLTIIHDLVTVGAECLGMTEDEWSPDPVYDGMFGLAIEVTERDND